MKKTIVGMLCGVLLCLSLGAATAPPRMWTDLLMRVSQQWYSAYGDYPESVLGYNSFIQQQAININTAAIKKLEARVAALEPTIEKVGDPNNPQ